MLLTFFVFKDLLLKEVVVVMKACLKVSLCGIRENWID
jgi:hypothetical protein